MRAIRHGAMLLLGTGLLFGASYLAEDVPRSAEAAVAAASLPLPPRGAEFGPLHRHRAAAAAGAELTTSDAEAIHAASLDYIEGWYTGDAERMTRALHPSLAKRIVQQGGSGRGGLGDMTAEQLISGTARGGGRSTPAAERGIGVQILDVYENAASVRVDARDWIDYMHLGRVDGRWVIINVLWELRPRAE